MASANSSAIDQLIEDGLNMVEILDCLKFDLSKVSATSTTAVPSSNLEPPKTTAQMTTEREITKKKSVQKKMKKVVSRRRRRHDESDSSGEDVEELSSSDSESCSLSVVSDNLGEDDLDLLDKLSDCSSSDEESSLDLSLPDKTLPLPQTPPTSHTSPRRGKRGIVLAATFNMIQPDPDQASISISDSPNTAASVDEQLGYLIAKTGQESIVYVVCSLVAKESYLVPLRVFMEWLESSPIAVTATASKVKRYNNYYIYIYLCFVLFYRAQL